MEGGSGDKHKTLLSKGKGERWDIMQGRDRCGGGVGNHLRGVERGAGIQLHQGWGLEGGDRTILVTVWSSVVEGGVGSGKSLSSHVLRRVDNPRETGGGREVLKKENGEGVNQKQG